jgi:hypothetical protein
VAQQVSVQGKVLVATAAVWIDRMPSPSPTDLRILASIRIVAEDGSAAPSALYIDRVSVARAEDVWVSTFVDRRSDVISTEGVIRQGPLWDNGATVDIVSDFTDSAGQHYQLRARTTTITTVY